jgi:hypothetical protein
MKDLSIPLLSLILAGFAFYILNRTKAPVPLPPGPKPKPIVGNIADLLYRLQVCKNGCTGLSTKSSTVLSVLLPSWARH